MIQTMRNAWKVPELRGKLLFTVFALLIFRLGSAVPVPFINVDMLSDYMTAQSASIFGLARRARRSWPPSPGPPPWASR